MSHMSDDLVLLRTFPDEPTALLAQSILEANGIGSIVSADSAGRMEPQLPFGRGIRLSIRPDDAEAALELLGPE